MCLSKWLAPFLAVGTWLFGHRIELCPRQALRRNEALTQNFWDLRRRADIYYAGEPARLCEKNTGFSLLCWACWGGKLFSLPNVMADVAGPTMIESMPHVLKATFLGNKSHLPHCQKPELSGFLPATAIFSQCFRKADKVVSCFKWLVQVRSSKRFGRGCTAWCCRAKVLGSCWAAETSLSERVLGPYKTLLCSPISGRTKEHGQLPAGSIMLDLLY